jgi:3'(2'), 5'-bisphosphate nucleotidase
MWGNELKIALLAAKEAGNAIMDIYLSGDFCVSTKSDRSPVTKADLAAGEIITGILSHEFSGYPILCEDNRDDEKRHEKEICWIVDPLDGTKEFIKRNGEFTVNIALVYRHEVVAGVVYVPAKECMYYASKNNGAWMQGKRIRVSDREKDIVMAVSRSHITDSERKLIEDNSISKVISAGSSIKGCLVAEGICDVYYRFGPTMEWDTAAMQCIIEEAGGIFRQLDDTPMTYNRTNSINDKGFYAVNNINNILHGRSSKWI